MQVFDNDGDDDVDCTVLATIEPELASRYTQFRSTSVEVPALTFASLTKDVDDIDVLHIDTEGHDAKILAQVDFDAWTLSAVLFEHHHLDPDELAFDDRAPRTARLPVVVKRLGHARAALTRSSAQQAPDT